MTDLLSARRILLCLRYGIGDIVMETPVLQALRNHTNAFIRGVGARPAIELLQGDTRIDDLASVNDWGLAHWGDYGGPRSRSRIEKWLSEEDHDLILDPSHAVIALKKAIWERNVPILDADGCVQSLALERVALGLDAIKLSVELGWGLKVPEEIEPSIQIDERAFDAADAFLRKRGVEAEPFLGLSPVASSHLKCWPIDRFAAVADALVERSGCRLLLFCGPQHRQTAEILANMQRADRVLVIPKLHLKRVSALISRCLLFVCNDTGLMHIAAAVGTPVVAIFGPTSPSLYLPRTRSKAVTGKAIGCPFRKERQFGPSDCIVRNRCLERRASCISDVGVEEVLSAAEPLLFRRWPRGARPAGSKP